MVSEATLSEKGWPKRPFERAFSTQCSALSDFFTLFWAILGSFWGHFGVILRLNLLSRKSPKYCKQWPSGAQREVQNGQKLKIWPHGAVSSAFWTILGRSNLVDLAGQQTPPIWCGAPEGGVWCPAPEGGGLFTRKIDQNLTSPKWSKMH